MKRLTAGFPVCVFAAALATVAACSSDRSPATETTSGGAADPPSTEGTGSVAFSYSLPGGKHLSHVAYIVTNALNTYEDTVDISGSSVITFVVGGVAAGTGYSATLALTSDDGLVNCNGSYGTGVSDAGQDNGAPFAVVSRQSTVVNVQLICVDPPNANQGSVLINGMPNCCPVWDTAVVNPPGPLCTSAPHNTTTLTGHASGPCDGDGGVGVSCVWSVKSGQGVVGPTTMDGRGDFVATFTCSGVNEQDTVQVDCTDGPIPSGGFCPPSLTHGELPVICGCPPPCSGPGESGIAATPDTAAGTCPNSPSTGNPMVNSGIADDRGDFCCVESPPP
jgi:hypothetical protein